MKEKRKKMLLNKFQEPEYPYPWGHLLKTNNKRIKKFFFNFLNLKK